MSARRVAVFGGSFDPPHLGHILSVAWTISAGDVDEVWVIPTWKHAFGKEHGADFDARAAMCELAFAPFAGVSVSDVERRLGGVSRTLQTLEALATEHPDVELRLLIGADVLPTTDGWHRWDDIVRLAPPLVIGREGYPEPAECPVSIPNVSSTEVRVALEQSSDLSGLVPSAVVDYIHQRGLYREAP